MLSQPDMAFREAQRMCAVYVNESMYVATGSERVFAFCQYHASATHAEIHSDASFRHRHLPKRNTQDQE